MPYEVAYTFFDRVGDFFDSWVRMRRGFVFLWFKGATRGLKWMKKCILFVESFMFFA